MTDPVRDRHSMLSGLTPVLSEGIYVFCSVPRQDTSETLLKDALCVLDEEDKEIPIHPQEKADWVQDDWRRTWCPKRTRLQS